MSAMPKLQPTDTTELRRSTVRAEAIAAELNGGLSRDERSLLESSRRTDGDRLAFLDANKVYLEFGPHRMAGSGYVVRDEQGWVSGLCLQDGHNYVEEPHPTLRDAIDRLMDRTNDSDAQEELEQRRAAA